MVVTEGCDRSVCGAIGCSEASTENTREKGKQGVKRDKSGLIPCPFISCVKANTKIGVGIDQWSLYILTTSDRVIGERAVATGVVSPP
jgi:hypothetical protein